MLPLVTVLTVWDYNAIITDKISFYIIFKKKNINTKEDTVKFMI
jgi:hypothetical protein